MKLRDEYPGMIAAVSEIDKARLAAFIDGEGTIYINVANRIIARMKSPQYRLALCVTGTNPIFMKWLKDTFDGSVYYVKYEKCTHLGKRQIMRWQVNNRMAETILKNVVQYMIIKKPQAEVGLAFMSLLQPRGGGNKRQPQLTESQLDQRLAMKLEIQKLNKADGIYAVQ